MAKRKPHPYADLFPMMTAAELDALAEDIAANGLRQPVILYGGAILDGRNRLAACEKANVEPRFEDFDGDDAGALALVISLNVQRRDLTAAQRAIVAARALPAFEATKKPGPKRGTDNPTSRAREDAAKVFKVGEKAVQQAKAILAEAPDLAGQVEVCTLSLAAAYEQLQARRHDATQKARDAERVADYTDAISSGEMSLEEAIQKAILSEREERERVSAQADARRQWLKGFAEALSWFERYLSIQEEDRMAWYTLPGSPGLFDHGITPKRIAAVVSYLERARTITFGGKK